MRLLPLSAVSALAATAGVTIEHVEGSNVAWLTIPKTAATPSTSVDVRVDGENLKFFPERSSGQRQLLTRLGILL